MSQPSQELFGHLLSPQADGRVDLKRGRVVLRDGWIESVESVEHTGSTAGAQRFDESGVNSRSCVISPGFVDAHLHLPQFDSIGADGLSLLDWLNTQVFPAEARWADANYASAMSRRVAARLLASGTTGVCAFATVHHVATLAAMRGLEAFGLHGYVGQTLMNRGGPPELNRTTSQLLEELAATPAAGSIRPIVSPRFALSCSMDLMQGAAQLAHERDWPVQTHYAETVPECQRVREAFGEDSYLSVYDRAGLLGPRTLLAHAVWMSDHERARLAESGTVVAHCPTANLFLNSGLMDLASMRTAGVRMALGSDVAGGPDVCMVRVARAMLETARDRALMVGTSRRVPSEGVPTAADCWWQITRGNAEMLGMADAGRIEPGCRADLVVLTPADGPSATPAWLSQPDPLAALLYGFDERWIERVYARGQVAFRR